MKISGFFAALSTLCLLGGCSGAVVDDPEAGQPAARQEGEPGFTKPAADPPEPLIRGNVSGTMPIQRPEECRPLGIPITFFLSGVFLLDALVEDNATPINATQCSHQQVLEGPADAWAGFAYSAICTGGGDSRLCGATATRTCSVDLLMRWAEERTEPVASTDRTFGFSYVMPPLDEASRTALDRRTLQEVESLIDESHTVIREHLAQTRDCPDEDLDEIMQKYFDGVDLHQRLSLRLSGE